MVRMLLAHRLRWSERGATAVEYAIMVAGIALVIFAAVATIGPPLSEIFQDAADSL